ncbi:MAG: Hsp20/alpha crystallin family protein [Phycisphaerales bacterium]|nr:Hsp20/alpha crystallin family protein [Phycisphaerales bacterium]
MFTLMRNPTMRPYHDVAREMSRMLDAFANRAPFDSMFDAAVTFPALNLWEDDHKVFVEAELPGVAAKDVEVKVHGNELHIFGKRESTSGDKRNFQRQERVFGEFSRMISLPTPVDAEKIEATLKDGVLTVILPKAETAKARKIAVKAV